MLKTIWSARILSIKNSQCKNHNSAKDYGSKDVSTKYPGYLPGFFSPPTQTVQGICYLDASRYLPIFPTGRPTNREDFTSYTQTEFTSSQYASLCSIRLFWASLEHNQLFFTALLEKQTNKVVGYRDFCGVNTQDTFGSACFSFIWISELLPLQPVLVPQNRKSQ